MIGENTLENLTTTRRPARSAETVESLPATPSENGTDLHLAADVDRALHHWPSGIASAADLRRSGLRHAPGVRAHVLPQAARPGRHDGGDPRGIGRQPDRHPLNQTKERNAMWSILGFCGLIGLEVAASCTTMSSQMESGWVGSANRDPSPRTGPHRKPFGGPAICVSDGRTGPLAVGGETRITQ